MINRGASEDTQALRINCCLDFCAQSIQAARALAAIRCSPQKWIYPIELCSDILKFNVIPVLSDEPNARVASQSTLVWVTLQIASVFRDHGVGALALNWLNVATAIHDRHFGRCGTQVSDRIEQHGGIVAALGGDLDGAGRQLSRSFDVYKAGDTSLDGAANAAFWQFRIEVFRNDMDPRRCAKLIEQYQACTAKPEWTDAEFILTLSLFQARHGCARESEYLHYLATVKFNALRTDPTLVLPLPIALLTDGGEWRGESVPGKTLALTEFVDTSNRVLAIIRAVVER